MCGMQNNTANKKDVQSTSFFMEVTAIFDTMKRLRRECRNKKTKDIVTFAVIQWSSWPSSKSCRIRTVLPNGGVMRKLFIIHKTGIPNVSFSVG